MHGRVINIHLPSDSKLTIPMSILDKERKRKFSLPLFFVDGASKDFIWPKGLYKTVSGTTKKYKNKNLSSFLF